MYIRQVQYEDLEFLYSLNNHPEIRRYSHNKKPFTYSEHEAYWKEKMTHNHEFEAGVIVHNEAKVGCIRRDRGVISIAIYPSFQNRGIGRKALEMFCRKGDKAEIQSDNRQSQHVFEQCGFWERYRVMVK